MAKGRYAEWLQPEKLILLGDWARHGLTDAQIAHNIGISAKTLYEWINRFSEIRDVLKANKDVCDAQVENALYQSALGFTGPDGRYYPPSTTAQIFWLKNRRRAEWRDHPESEAESAQLTKAAELLAGIESVID